MFVSRGGGYPSGAGKDEWMDASQLSGLGWTRMVEQSWPELMSAGLPKQLASLAEELGRHRGRPIRVFTMPMLEVGVVGLALPFVADDGVAFDPSLLLAGSHGLGDVVAHELAHMLDPQWDSSGVEEQEAMEAFASRLAPMLLAEPPDREWKDVVAQAGRGANADLPQG